MSRFPLFLILVLLFLQGCYKKPQSTSQTTRNNVIFYIDKGADDSQSYARREAYTDSAFYHIKQESNNKTTREQLLTICLNYRQLIRAPQLKRCAKIAYSYAREVKDTTDILRAQYYLGKAYMFESQNDSAYYFFNKVLKAGRRVGNLMTLASCNLALSELHYYTSNYSEVERSALNAISIARKMNDKILEGTAYNWIAISANELGNYSEANHYYDMALKLCGEDDVYIGYKLHCKGFNSYRAGRLKESIETYRCVLDKIKSPSVDPLLYCRVMDDMGHSIFALTQPDSVIAIYLKSRKIREMYGVDTGRNYNCLYISEYYAHHGDTLKAIAEAQRALTISENYKAPKDRLVCLKQLILLNFNKKAYFNDYLTLSDSLQLAERRNRNKFARIAFETDEIVVEKDRAIKQKWIVSAVASTLLLFTTLLFIIRLQRARQKELVLIHQQQKTDESIYQLINDQQLKVDEGRQAEKKRIARELHDGIMNRLASTRLNLFILNKSQEPETIKKCLSFINNIQDIEKEIRQVAHDLNQEIFSENKGFDLLLETLFETYRNVDNIKLFTEIDPAFNWEMTESALRMNIYRILQEALQNSYKYAHAKNIFVTLTREENSARIIVHDDGTGFNTKKVKRGMGLKSIATRAAEMQGEFKIISAPGEGTIVDVLLPLSREIV